MDEIITKLEEIIKQELNKKEVPSRGVLDTIETFMHMKYIKKFYLSDTTK